MFTGILLDLYHKAKAFSTIPNLSYVSQVLNYPTNNYKNTYKWRKKAMLKLKL